MALIIIAAYFIGSVPFAWILAQRRGAGDLRRLGSGNVGATNLVRVSGLSAGLTVALLDAAKGAASVWLAPHLSPHAAAPAAAGLAAIVGHVYPVWLRFHGGKGVATACGAFAMLIPLASVPALAVFIATVLLTKYVSLASVLASATLPWAAYLIGVPVASLTAAVAAAGLVIFRHRGNLRRLRSGTERRFSRPAGHRLPSSQPDAADAPRGRA
jgi:glycerol-3-phosphate acyltransferase PlsY